MAMDKPIAQRRKAATTRGHLLIAEVARGGVFTDFGSVLETACSRGPSLFSHHFSLSHKHCLHHRLYVEPPPPSDNRA